MKRSSLHSLALLVGFHVAAAPDPIFDVAAITAVPLNPRVLKSSEQDGIIIEEVMFHSEDDGDRSVDIFGLFCYPKGASKVPAFVWNQGGLNPATLDFPMRGAKRGYAVLCIDFPIPKRRSTGGYPITSGLEVGDDPRQAPIAHGVVALLQAVSYLETRPEVDPDRIGMAGSSWGGFYTTLMAGIDPRLKAASAMFGTGNLQLGNGWWDGRGASTKDAAARERWRTTLDPALRLPSSKVAIAWFTGTNDSFYWLSAVQQTFAMAREPKLLSLFPNWNHGLPPYGDDEVFEWLDVHLQNAPALTGVEPLKLVTGPTGTLAEWTYRSARTVTSAELILSYGDEGNWTRRCWIALPATWVQGRCSVELPVSDVPYLISGTMIDSHGYRSSTPLLRVDRTNFHPDLPRRPLDYDGAGAWGGFEQAQVAQLKAVAVRVPPITSDGHGGLASAELTAGSTLTLPPLLYAAGIPHSLRFYLKSAAATTVIIAVSQTHESQVVTQRSEQTVGKDWKAVDFRITPKAEPGTDLKVTLTAPADASVLLDDVSFRPLPN